MARAPKATIVTPMNAPAGSPGNMQDVSDLQQMLAQTQAELKAARAKVEELEEDVSDLKIEVDNANGAAAGAQDEADDLERENQDLKELLSLHGSDVPDLVRARDLLMKGDCRGGAGGARARPRPHQFRLDLRRLQCRPGL